MMRNLRTLWMISLYHLLLRFSPNPKSLSHVLSSVGNPSLNVPSLKKLNNNNNGENTLGVPFEESLLDAQNAIDLFLNNQFDSARDIVKPYADRSIYHALGYGTFMFLKAVMTF
ncbi:unnamed protein product [Lepeophtheirus salmonis]|uniref:(salmon louse) hypothetical protein n=1 Tax=Lepeophtheirus salmonis TaxID=72036 RepID=A0A7R8CJD4_LEPSM|nr:unnamed protein product [Lepeophtheirus salmonis]CAF2837764.1 unnamed protein product [Lepeophtheirus salmonis]